MPLVDKHILRKIETELYAYPTKSQEIRDLRQDILHGTIFSDVRVSGGEIGNQTQSKGIRLAEANDPWVELIRNALSIMPAEYRKIIENYYFRHKHMRFIADELHISERLAYAWRENALMTIVLMATQQRLIQPFGTLGKN